MIAQVSDRGQRYVPNYKDCAPPLLFTTAHPIPVYLGNSISSCSTWDAAIVLRTPGLHAKATNLGYNRDNVRTGTYI